MIEPVRKLQIRSRSIIRGQGGEDASAVDIRRKKGRTLPRQGKGIHDSQGSQEQIDDERALPPVLRDFLHRKRQLQDVRGAQPLLRVGGRDGRSAAVDSPQDSVRQRRAGREDDSELHAALRRRGEERRRRADFRRGALAREDGVRGQGKGQGGKRALSAARGGRHGRGFRGRAKESRTLGASGAGGEERGKGREEGGAGGRDGGEHTEGGEAHIRAVLRRHNAQGRKLGRRDERDVLFEEIQGSHGIRVQGIPDEHTDAARHADALGRGPLRHADSGGVRISRRELFRRHIQEEDGTVAEGFQKKAESGKVCYNSLKKIKRGVGNARSRRRETNGKKRKGIRDSEGERGRNRAERRAGGVQSRSWNNVELDSGDARLGEQPQRRGQLRHNDNRDEARVEACRQETPVRARANRVPERDGHRAGHTLRGHHIPRGVREENRLPHPAGIRMDINRHTRGGRRRENRDGSLRQEDR